MQKTMFMAGLLAATIMAAPAHAMSITDFKTRNNHDQTIIMTDFIDKMTGDLRVNNPQLAHNIHDYFFVTPAGEKFAEGLLRFEAELSALERAAKEGKVDLSKIEIEGVIVKVVKDKFPPPQ